MYSQVKHKRNCELVRLGKPCSCGATLEEKIPGRAPVLIKCYGDGRIEVYADINQVQVKFVDVPYVQPPDHPLAEQYVENHIPFAYRGIYWPVNLIATHWLRKILPSEIYWRTLDLQIINTVKQLRSVIK